MEVSRFYERHHRSIVFDRSSAIVGYNFLFEIVFASWYALTVAHPLNASDHLMHCYATALKLMRHTSIPVPNVFNCGSGSSKENGIGVSYIS